MRGHHRSAINRLSYRRPDLGKLTNQLSVYDRHACLIFLQRPVNFAKEVLKYLSAQRAVVYNLGADEIRAGILVEWEGVDLEAFILSCCSWSRNIDYGTIFNEVMASTVIHLLRFLLCYVYVFEFLKN